MYKKERENIYMARLNPKAFYPHGTLFIRRNPNDATKWEVVSGAMLGSGKDRVFELKEVLKEGLSKGGPMENGARFWAEKLGSGPQLSKKQRTEQGLPPVQVEEAMKPLSLTDEVKEGEEQSAGQAYLEEVKQRRARSKKNRKTGTDD